MDRYCFSYYLNFVYKTHSNPVCGDSRSVSRIDVVTRHGEDRVRLLIIIIIVYSPSRSTCMEHDQLYTSEKMDTFNQRVVNVKV